MAEKKKKQPPDSTIFKEEILKRITIPDGQYEPFLKLWEPMTFKRNEFMLQAGEVPKFSMFVLKGCLRQYIVTEKGEEAIVYFAEERYFVGDLPAMRNRTPSAFYFQAIEDCVLLTLSTAHWEQASVEMPWWTTGHLIGFQRWATKMQEKVAEQTTLTGEERYLNLLKERPSLFQRVPQHYIASYLGMSPETLSRIRKKLYNM